MKPLPPTYTLVFLVVGSNQIMCMNLSVHVGEQTRKDCVDFCNQKRKTPRAAIMNYKTYLFHFRYRFCLEHKGSVMKKPRARSRLPESIEIRTPLQPAFRLATVSGHRAFGYLAEKSFGGIKQISAWRVV